MSRGNAAVKAKRQQTILSLVGRERLASQVTSDVHHRARLRPRRRSTIV